ncbi:sialate O-acetylesterase [Roseobacter sp.]|uniref:sialate O-acetylesterase n=1 Tax=Roseobacter sp. TaxID=1907202 RepID=UPI002965D525|nr:sialate O-acetylesterase [Roseobacter sp.]MDW3181221.1 sialate O-acetylesterase [Roseobacter sp.]
MIDFLFRNTVTGALIRASGTVPFDASGVVGEGTWQVATVSPWADNVLTVSSNRTTHVFLLAGQSNATSRVAFDGGADWPGNVRQWSRSPDNADASFLTSHDDQVLIPATRPLDHGTQRLPGAMGWALQFSIDYLAQHPDVDLVLVPAARGGSGFQNNRWNPGNDLFQDAVDRSNALMAAHPDFLFRGILWHQGETDAETAGDAGAHAAAQDAMIAALRSGIAAADDSTPFVLGGLAPPWVAGNSNRQTVQAGIEDTPNRVAYSSYADSTGLSVFDGIHFDAASMRTLGARYATALANADQNVPDGWQIADQTIHSYTDVPTPIVVGTTVMEGS